MVTSPNVLKILEWDEKLQTNKQTMKHKDFDQKIKVLKTWGLEQVYANYQEQNLYMDIL